MIITCFTNYFVRLIFNTYFTSGSLYLALFNTPPIGGLVPFPGAEVTTVGTGYHRMPITFGSPFVDRAGNIQVANNGPNVQFPTATASWGIINGVGIMDSLTGGLLYTAGQVKLNGANVTLVVAPGDDGPLFVSGGLQIVNNALASNPADPNTNNGFYNDFLAAVMAQYLSGATTYAGLLTAAASPTTSGTECSDAGYARQAVTWAGAQPNSVSGYFVTGNTNTLTFPNATAGYTVIGTGIYDALTAGNLLVFNNVIMSNGVATPKVLAAGQHISFPLMNASARDNDYASLEIAMAL